MRKVAFICMHNSCRSQIAEALGKHLRGTDCDFYSAGVETKPQINQDAVRLMKELYGIDMEKTQYSKLISDIPNLTPRSPWAATWDVPISARLSTIIGICQIQPGTTMKLSLTSSVASRKHHEALKGLDQHPFEAHQDPSKAF